MRHKEWWTHASTFDLLHQMAKLKIIVNRRIALEIAKRDDFPAVLNRKFKKLLRTSEGWFSIHVPYLVSLKPTGDKIATFVHLLKKFPEVFLSRSSVDLHSSFVAFGPEYSGELAWIVKNLQFHPKIRAAAFRALVMMASSPERWEALNELAFEITPDDPALSGILPFMALLGGDALSRAMELAAGNESLRDSVRDASTWGIQLVIRKPWDWFDPENLFYIHLINFGPPHVKGSDPCPCGSRKRFRECCMPAWHRARHRMEEFGLERVLLVPRGAHTP